jgi:predicted dithiol-disulfide oxidoreductase (DUF899 family)
LYFSEKNIYNFKEKKLQVRKRERMAKLREEIAVEKAKEMELNKTIHITGLFNHSSQILIYECLLHFNLLIILFL